ncbi:MAG: outer membrane beta-barrel protein [Calditrichaceae bacterium]|nr:outer membrane beta-barrel protein [Calditrichaceae bacterium]
MRTRLTVLALVMVFAGVSLVQAQGIKYGVGAGLNVFTGDAAKAINMTDPGSGGFGFTAEPAIGVKAKFSLPLMPLSIAAHLNYTMMSSSAEALGNKLEIETNMLTVGLGGEFSLIPGPLSPYLAADLLYNSNGKREAKLNDQLLYEEDGESRFGLGIGVGVTFSLLPMIDLDVSAKYNFNNVFGKEDDEIDVNTIMIQAFVLF